MKKEDEGAIVIEEPQFQNFLKKVSKIIILYMNDHDSGKDLHRSVLKYCKTVIFFLNPQILKDEIAADIIKGIFSLQVDPKTKNKHNVLIKKVINKLIKKLGLKYTQSIVPEEHQKLLAYIERDKRKRHNKSQKKKLLELLGDEDKKLVKNSNEIGFEGDTKMADAKDKNDSEEGSSDDEDKYSLNSDSDNENYD